MIQVKELLLAHNIRFIEYGKNVKRGNFNINCPYCAESESPDPSFHLGIDPVNLVYACWRDPRHRGRNIARLLSKLGIYVDVAHDRSEIEKLSSGIRIAIPRPSRRVHLRVDTLPPTFSVIRDGPLDKRYLNYLRYRGFQDPEKAVEQFNLHRCTDLSKWQDRLIIPVYMPGQLTWTGRLISDPPEGSPTPKYLSPSIEALNIKSSLFGYMELLESNWKRLYVLEGPLDAMKFNYFAPEDIRSTCLFGLVISDEQVALLRKIHKQRPIHLAMDNTATMEAMLIAKHLDFCKPHIFQTRQKDIGAMNEREIQEFIREQ